MMDWELGIARQRTALLRIVASLFAMVRRGGHGEHGGQFTVSPTQGAATPDAGLGGDSKLSPALALPTLPRCLHRAVLRVLRPAESAARRLVIAMAQTLPVPALRQHTARPPAPASTFIKNGAGTGIVMPRRPPAARTPPVSLTLPLFDPLRTPFRPRRVPQSCAPRITAPGFTKLFPVAPRQKPRPDDRLDATRLRLRLEAVFQALDDLPAAALRFARWQAHAAAARNAEAGGAKGSGKKSRAPAKRHRRVSPLRPGRPPGFHRKAPHDVHVALNVSHWLARTALERRDTS